MRKERMAVRVLAEFVDKSLGEVLTRRGFAGAEIVVAWPDIVGEPLAGRSEPLKLVWPRKPAGLSPEDAGRGAATLIVRVESAFALDLQQRAPIVIERLNSYFGWRCVERLKFEQAPVRRRKRPAEAPPPDPGALAAAREKAAPIADEPLRAAVERLGVAVLSRSRRDGGA